MPEPAPSHSSQESRYERAYSLDPASAALYARWRALGAVGKAEHVISLCVRAGIRPASTLDIGCGDGALLCELRRRGFGGRLAGAEISSAAVAIASRRAEIDAVERYDGVRLPAPDGAYDLGILSHVLEHVADPAALLREAGRTSRALVMEVPLEANLSARRAAKRSQSEQIGHIQRLDRSGARAIVACAGLSIAAELEDSLPLQAQLFFAAGAPARAAAALKWAVRAGLHGGAPALARRLFTVHYACLCLPDGSRRPASATAPCP
jgi:SAM-dependent methyltransferase